MDIKIKMFSLVNTTHNIAFRYIAIDDKYMVLKQDYTKASGRITINLMEGFMSFTIPWYESGKKPLHFGVDPDQKSSPGFFFVRSEIITSSSLKLTDEHNFRYFKRNTLILQVK